MFPGIFSRELSGAVWWMEAERGVRGLRWATGIYNKKQQQQQQQQQQTNKQD